VKHLFAVIAVTDTGMMIRQMVTCAKLVMMKIMSDVKDVMRLYTMMMLVIMKMKNIMTTRIAESVLTWTR
jgi:hypothetical protein